VASGDEPFGQKLPERPKPDDGYVEGSLLLKALRGLVLIVKGHGCIQCHHPQAWRRVDVSCEAYKWPTASFRGGNWQCRSWLPFSRSVSMHALSLQAIL